MAQRGRPRGSFKHLHPTRIDGKVTRAWTKYQGMIQRCYNPKAHNYAWYGGDGVTVCDSWCGPSGYDNFILDMGLPPPGLTLDRIEGEKVYSKATCKWSTWKEQAASRRQKSVDADSLNQKAIAAGLPYSTVYQRIKLLGWTEAEALSTPMR